MELVDALVCKAKMKLIALKEQAGEGVTTAETA